MVIISNHDESSKWRAIYMFVFRMSIFYLCLGCLVKFNVDERKYGCQIFSPRTCTHVSLKRSLEDLHACNHLITVADAEQD